MLLKDGGASLPAQRLAAGTLSLGDAFSFVSGLYFRGKLAYARHFAADRTPGVAVITPTRGLQPPELIVDGALLREFVGVDLGSGDPRYLEPLVRDLRDLSARLPPGARAVLLGSVATAKYLEPIADVLGDRLFFPRDFIGRGDMSRGALLLQRVDANHELDYVPFATGVVRRGPRAPGVAQPRSSKRATMDPRDATPDEIDALAHLWFEGWRDAHATIVPVELVRLRTLDNFRERLRAAIAETRVDRSARRAARLHDAQGRRDLSALRLADGARHRRGRGADRRRRAASRRARRAPRRGWRARSATSAPHGSTRSTGGAAPARWSTSPKRRRAASTWTCGATRRPSALDARRCRAMPCTHVHGPLRARGSPRIVLAGPRSRDPIERLPA